jgi:hypothetical protein
MGGRVNTRSLLEVLAGPPEGTLRQRIARFGVFEVLWLGFVLGTCSLLVHNHWRWWEVLYVGLFAAAMPLYIGPAAEKPTGIKVVCLNCGKHNSDPGGDVTGWSCGYCGAQALERRCFECKRPF